MQEECERERERERQRTEVVQSGGENNIRAKDEGQK